MKMIKKITISAIVLVLAFFFAFTVNVKADGTQVTSEYIEVKGASVRLVGNQGIRFEGKVNTSKYTASIKEYHILLAYGKVIDPTKIVEGATVNGQVVLDGKDEAGIDANGKYYITLFGIPEKYYDQPVTARAYVVLSDDSVVYGETVTTRNLIDTAREAYSKSNDYDTGDNLVTQLVANKNVKVTNAAGEVSYRSSLEGLTIAKGDIIDIAKGTYATALTINVNDVTINGVYAGILPTGSTKTAETFKSEYETTFTNPITIAKGIKNVVISGIRFTGASSLILTESQENITLKYCTVEYTGNAGVTDDKGTAKDYTSITHKNINILKNLFYAKNSKSNNRSVYFQGYVNNINVEGNTFKSTGTSINSSEFNIRLNRVSSNSYVNIMQNTFKSKTANYIVDMGYSSIGSNTYINIEDNEGVGASSGDEFKGNGFKIANFDSSTTINIIHNIRLRFSKQYNAIYISEKYSSFPTSVSKTPTINIKYNKIYSDQKNNVTNSNRTDTIEDKSILIGLAFASGASVTISDNYFSGSIVTKGYGTNSSVTAEENLFAIAADKLNENACTSNGQADERYSTSTELATLLTELKEYNEFLTGLSANVEAYSGGADSKNIVNYIPTFNATKYANKLEIQNGKLVYIGTDAQEQLTAARISIFNASSIKPTE